MKTNGASRSGFADWKSRVTSLWILLIAVAAAGCATTTSTMAAEGGTAPPARTYSHSAARVFSEALNAVSLLTWELTHTEREVGVIQAVTPRSFLTDGDQVMIRIEERPDGTTIVNISSTTRQAIDWGKNRANIEKFFEELDVLLAGGQSTGPVNP